MIGRKAGIIEIERTWVGAELFKWPERLGLPERTNNFRTPIGRQTCHKYARVTLVALGLRCTKKQCKKSYSDNRDHKPISNQANNGIHTPIIPLLGSFV